MPLTSPALTVAVCTWNRAGLLDQTLTRMRDLRVPAGLTWELLVVDNNCTDDTDAVLARHAAALPLRRLFEPRQGHSNARNRAIEEARGALLIWTDDDVLVDPDWLAAYAAAEARWPEAGFFGGRISPWFEHEPPRWVTRHVKRLEGMLVVRDLGPDERPLAPGEFPFGANMAFRTAHLRAHRFDPTLGKTKDVCVLADDLDVCRRLQAAGVTGVWVPGAAVRHFVTAGRLTRAFTWQYFHGIGRTAVRTGEIRPGEDGARLWGAPRWLYRPYWRARATGVARRAFGLDWVESYAAAATWAGVIHEARAGGGGRDR